MDKNLKKKWIYRDHAGRHSIGKLEKCVTMRSKYKFIDDFGFVYITSKLRSHSLGIKLIEVSKLYTLFYL